ncbi:MAG: hypothetical protein GX961_07885 [Firmicutes bacterium]|nr:hypothetical protein [Bacillota bacterium]
MVQRPEAKRGPGLRQAAWAGRWRQAVLGVLLGLLVALPAAAQVDGLLSEGSRTVEGPVVALFPLQVLNQTPADSEDLRLLAEALPDALAARLVQSGQFRPLTGVRLQRHLGAAGIPAADGDATAEGMRAWLQEAAEGLLEQGQVQEAVLGRLMAVQGGLVAVVERYQLSRRPAPTAQLVGSAVAVADKAPAMLEKAADLLRQLYPPETEVVPRAVERLVVLPSALRLPIGQSHKLNVLAFDQDGTLLPNVTLVFQSGDEGRVAVSSDGVVTALAPGEATVQVQALGRPTTAGAASVTVQVLAPTLGFRGGATVAGTAGQAENPLVFGLRLTPSAAFQTTAQRVDLSRGLENPLTFLTGFFSSLLGGGRVTLDLDARPSQDLTVMLEAMQRSSSGYFGTGVGLVAPLRQGIESGLAVRLTLGTQMSWFRGHRFTIPVELNADLIFRRGEEAATEARLALVTGIDLFQ